MRRARCWRPRATWRHSVACQSSAGARRSQPSSQSRRQAWYFSKVSASAPASDHGLSGSAVADRDRRCPRSAVQERRRARPVATAAARAAGASAGRRAPRRSPAAPARGWHRARCRRIRRASGSAGWRRCPGARPAPAAASGASSAAAPAPGPGAASRHRPAAARFPRRAARPAPRAHWSGRGGNRVRSASPRSVPDCRRIGGDRRWTMRAHAASGARAGFSGERSGSRSQAATMPSRSASIQRPTAKLPRFFRFATTGTPMTLRPARRAPDRCPPRTRRPHRARRRSTWSCRAAASPRCSGRRAAASRRCWRR